MDDYARTLYMIALRKFQDSEFPLFVCSELKRTLRAEGPSIPFSVVTDDVFHHFKALFDGVRWTKAGRKYICSSESAWWEGPWQEPRVRALECLLRN